MSTGAEILDGVLLSDGGSNSPYKATHLSVALSGEEHIDWLLQVKDALSSMGISVCSGHPKLLSRVSYWGKKYTYCYLKTRASSGIDYLYDKWYPHGVKIVPEDIILTPVSVAHWFMGDGNSNKDLRCCSVTVSLCTRCFDLRSIEVLEAQLRLLGIHSGRGHVKVIKGSGIILTIKQDSVNRFMSMVEPYILSSYKYKVKYRTSMTRRRAAQKLWAHQSLPVGVS